MQNEKRKVTYPDGPTDRNVQGTSEQSPLCFFFIPSALPARRILKRFSLRFSSLPPPV